MSAFSLSNNVTDIDLSWMDPFDLLDGNLPAKIGLAIFQICILVFGSAVYLTMMSLDHFAGNPQKQSLFSKVIKSNPCLKEIQS